MKDGSIFSVLHLEHWPKNHRRSNPQPNVVMAKKSLPLTQPPDKALKLRAEKILRNGEPIGAASVKVEVGGKPHFISIMGALKEIESLLMESPA
jgi:hypothetical protein